MVPKDGFEKKKTSLALNETEKLCDAVTAYHKNGIYAQLGYSLLAKENVDVAPSITYLFANYPKKVTFKAADIDDVVSVIPALTCDIETVDPTISIDAYFEYVLHKSGFVGADCIPNTEVPADTTKCSEAAGNYKKNFENYKQAVFKGKPDTIKQVLINFGAVRIYNGTVIVGWDAENWVTVEEAPIPVVVTPTRNVDEDPEGETDLLPYEYVLGTKPISTWDEVQGFVFNNGFTALRAALGLIAAVLVLPALLL